MTELLVVVGARPNFIKAASIGAAAHRADLTYTIVHTGQHYDHELAQVFFDELPIAAPDITLGVGSGSHAAQTARVMLAFEHELLQVDPRFVVVVGDVNSALACALVARKEGYPVVHVEAGLRCGDEWMAEEINRRLCDHLSTHLFTTCRDADENLRREGIPAERIDFVGNTMIDTLLRVLPHARERRAPARYGLDRGSYALLTLHRAENVDSPERLAQLVDAVALVSRWLPVAIPLHPRTHDRLARQRLLEPLSAEPGVRLLHPLGYLDFVGLMDSATLVLTDSGGVQEETTALGVPCLTLRRSTERPVTIVDGTNRLVGVETDRIAEETLNVLEQPPPPRGVPELWDGRAGDRIVGALVRKPEVVESDAVVV